jgi:hypothetical protein
MTAAIIIAVIAVLVMFFPAAYVWYLNIGGVYAAIKRAREKRAVRAEATPDLEISNQGNYQGAEMTPMKRAALGALFFLVAILFPVLIWVALFIVVRKPLLRAMRRAGYAALFFLIGIFMFVLIWAGFVIAMRRPLLRGVRWFSSAWCRIARSKRAMRRIAYVPLFLLVAILMPVLIWVALVLVIRQLLLHWQESRLPSTLVCSFDSDCPPGYVCIAGRCVPQY